MTHDPTAQPHPLSNVFHPYAPVKQVHGAFLQWDLVCQNQTNSPTKPRLCHPITARGTPAWIEDSSRAQTRPFNRGARFLGPISVSSKHATVLWLIHQRFGGGNPAPAGSFFFTLQTAGSVFFSLDRLRLKKKTQISQWLLRGRWSAWMDLAQWLYNCL